MTGFILSSINVIIYLEGCRGCEDMEIIFSKNSGQGPTFSKYAIDFQEHQHGAFSVYTATEKNKGPWQPMQHPQDTQRCNRYLSMKVT